MDRKESDMSETQDVESLAVTASLADLETILQERSQSGEKPVTWEQVQKDLAL
jgi:hypothetical protein